jgi:hypothetical protein
MSSVMRFDEWQDSNGNPVLDGTGGGLQLGKIIDVKSAIFTGTQSSSINANARLDITDLTISHAVSDAANRIVLMAMINGGRVATAGGTIRANGTDILTPTSPGSRSTAMAMNAGGNNDQHGSVFVSAVYTPGSTSSVTYTASVVNLSATSPLAVYVNRGVNDADNGDNMRTVSTLMLMEVKA